MINPKILKKLKKSAAVWNQWRMENPEGTLDLSWVDLSGLNLRTVNLRSAILTEADFVGTDLYGADLRGANLTWADLSHTDLQTANLCNANLSHANLSGADLKKANLIGAHLNGTNLRKANLTGAILHDTFFSSTQLAGANFSKAKVWDTLFADVDLRDAQGLESVIQEGPSTIGVDTLYRSNGKIPPAFLSNAGIPENLIAQIKSLTTTQIPFDSFFIRGSAQDRQFCEILWNELKNKGVRNWILLDSAFENESVKRKSRGLYQSHCKLILVCSKHSLESDWIEEEIGRAIDSEIQEKTAVLFPIILDRFYEQWDNPRQPNITESLAGDFTQWKQNPHSFQTNLQRLVHALHGDI